MREAGKFICALLMMGPLCGVAQHVPAEIKPDTRTPTWYDDLFRQRGDPRFDRFGEHDPTRHGIMDTVTWAPDSIRRLVDFQPVFPGGDEALRTYLDTNLIYPELALEISSEGRVRVAFVVWPDGHLTDVHVPKGEPHPELHQEALRLVRNMPKWVPAYVNGSVVAADASVVVLFRIRY
ncbi:MAG: energy transducer TonB [Flavobacteriales bacterium]|nr:energy transducer TonB [Flavobacteriales bacterium]